MLQEISVNQYKFLELDDPWLIPGMIANHKVLLTWENNIVGGNQYKLFTESRTVYLNEKLMKKSQPEWEQHKIFPQWSFVLESDLCTSVRLN